MSRLNRKRKYNDEEKREQTKKNITKVEIQSRKEECFYNTIAYNVNSKKQ